jgi:hypothetical protein
MASHTVSPPRPEAPPPPAATNEATDAALMKHNLEFMQMTMQTIESLSERLVGLEAEVTRLRKRLNE